MRFDINRYLSHPRVLHRFRDGLYIFNYDHACVYEKAWDEITKSSRGLVLDEGGNCVVRCFEKFFNLNEVEATRLENLPDLPFTATEKMDGYLGLAFPWRGLWHVSTRGAFDSEMAVWGTQWFRENAHPEAMDPDYSYHFEIVYSRKIVIRYDFEGLVLLTAVHKETGEEMPYERLAEEAPRIGVRVTPLMPKFPTLLALAEYVKGLPADREGCVVTFSNGLKVKIKGEEYCRIHKIVSRMTPLAFWEAYDIEEGRIPQSYLECIPEEFREESEAIRSVIEGGIADDVRDVGVACWEVEDALPAGFDVKAFALKAREMHPGIFGSVMNYYKRNMTAVRKTAHRNRRPTGNNLDMGGEET